MDLMQSYLVLNVDGVARQALAFMLSVANELNSCSTCYKHIFKSETMLVKMLSLKNSQHFHPKVQL
jgi:hypothetical protein